MLICATTRIGLQKQHHRVLTESVIDLGCFYLFFPPSLAQHLVKIMAEAPDVNRLSTAAVRGDLRETEKILESNINVNAKNKFGRTPLQVGDDHKLFTFRSCCLFVFVFF